MCLKKKRILVGNLYEKMWRKFNNKSLVAKKIFIIFSIRFKDKLDHILLNSATTCVGNCRKTAVN